MIWQTFIDPAFSTWLCLTLVHSVWQFAVLAFVVWCLNLIWKNQTVERRYTVNVLALLLGIAALPVTFLIINSAENSGKPVIQAQAMATTANPPSEPRMITPDQSAFVIPAEIQAVEPPIESAENNTANQTSFAADSPGVTLRGWLQITPWIVAIYVLGVGFMLARLIISMVKVNRLSARATVIKQGPLVESLRSLAKQWSMKMVPVLAEAEHIVVPTVVGLIRPLILLPTSVVSGLTPDELEMILAHELAHVRRYDMWVNLLQRLAEAVLFFNPALWYLSRQISGLREFCCDDLTCREQAASDFECKVRYATALLRVVELSKPNLATNPELTSLAANGHSPSEVRRRVARLFDEPLREPLRLTRSMTYAVLALLLIGVPAVWSTYAENQSSAETVQLAIDTPTDAESTEPYSLDGNVEVLSMGTYKETPQRWWDTVGTSLSPRPYRVHGASIPVNEKQIGRQLVFRVNHLPQHATLSWTVSNKESGGNAFVAFKGKERAKGYYAQVFAANQDLKSVDLRVGVANGIWKTKIKMDADNRFGDVGLTESALRQNQPIVYNAMMSGPFTQKDEIVVISMHDIQDREMRIVAIDKQGEMHRSVISSNMSITQEAYSIYKARFKDLQLEQLDRFEFQTRPFEYIEFKNLPLNPQAKQNTVEHNTAATGSPAPVENAVGLVRQPPSAKLSFVIAKHVILLEGKEIITWEEIDSFFGTLPDTSLITPAFYITRGALVAGLDKSTKEKIGELHRKYKFNGLSQGTLWPRTDFRYDKIKTAADLRPDPALKMAGTIVNQKGTPIEGAEVALILPVDKSIGYQTYHVALVLGHIRNRLEHVMTTSNSSGQFELYPPQEEKYYILAMHPEAGFSLVRSDRIQVEKEIKLLPWAGLKTKLDEVSNETQTVSLTNDIEADQGWPEIMFNQYWSDLPQEVQERGFVYNQIPPYYRTTISRSFKQPDGGGFSIPGASVNLMPGEKRELGLGPLSNKQRSLLEGMRESSSKRQRSLEEKPKVKAKPQRN